MELVAKFRNYVVFTDWYGDEIVVDTYSINAVSVSSEKLQPLSGTSNSLTLTLDGGGEVHVKSELSPANFTAIHTRQSVHDPEVK